jgi:hypothetical protein
MTKDINDIQVRTLELTSTLDLVAHKGKVFTLDEFLRDMTIEALEQEMDKKIRKIEKTVRKSEKELKELERLDKKRDPYCEKGMEVMKKKKKK